MDRYINENLLFQSIKISENLFFRFLIPVGSVIQLTLFAAHFEGLNSINRELVKWQNEMNVNRQKRNISISSLGSRRLTRSAEVIALIILAVKDQTPNFKSTN